MRSENWTMTTGSLPELAQVYVTCIGRVLCATRMPHIPVDEVGMVVHMLMPADDRGVVLEISSGEVVFFFFFGLCICKRGVIRGRFYKSFDIRLDINVTPFSNYTTIFCQMVRSWTQWIQLVPG